ncbi:MAG: uncharacterized protein PWP28_928 [Oceanotoga sp.]|jgi:hypothetical protein|uniref:Uncharacterized protein n=1 Tax=Oceanotoga teriensis TaxID=515440 RepID=A0AA45C8M6_9BACT|nr:MULTISPECIES: hypothetical protein [Oceanotoga]MDN5342053.1 uncharacterized protein [Oceanotoga sp.]PWJ96235.1 hypothetical protein C7380_102152 [Oceanotoga teriensis]
MENVVKAVEDFFEKKPDADFDELDIFLNNNFSKEEIEKYYELLSETLGGMKEVIENPVEMFTKDQKENVISGEYFELVNFPKEERLRSLKVAEWKSGELEPGEYLIDSSMVGSYFIQNGNGSLILGKNSLVFFSGDLITFNKVSDDILKVDKKVICLYKK